MAGLFILIIALVIYFIPVIIACDRGHPQTYSIAVINIFLGWTFVGWVIALAMALSAVKKEIRIDKYDRFR